MKIIKKLFTLTLITLIAVVLAYQIPQYFSFLKFIEYWEDDFRIATLSPKELQHAEIIVVTITEDTLALFPYRAPIDRHFVSDLLKNLESKGVKAILLDFLFDQATEIKKDQELKNTINTLKTPLVISYADNIHGINVNPKQQQYLDDFVPIELRGLANVAKDNLGTVRWIYPGHHDKNGRYINGVVNTLAIKLGDYEKVSLNRKNRIAWHGTPDSETLAFRTFPAHMIKVLPAAWFKDKVILVGSELSITDRHRTPFSLAPEINRNTTLSGTPGIFVLAHSLAHVLDQRQYPNMSSEAKIALIAIFAVIGIAFAHLKTRFYLNIILGVIALGSFWILAINHYAHSGLLISMTLPSLSMIISFILTSIHIAITADIEKEVAIEETKVKSEFLANMSHEIRSPMNAIMGMTELVLDSNINHTQRKHLTIVLSSARALLNLINDILDLSKLESGKMQMEETTFNLRQMLEDTIATLSVQAKAKGLELNLEVEAELPPCYIGDPLRLRQVIMNLTNNAIKFTETGYVQVRVQLDKQDPEYLLVIIEDSGIGIPTNRQAAVFESFTQVDGSTSRKHGGTGLGTTISKQIVEMMQGKIWLESEEGCGSTFYFTLRIPEAKGVSDCKIEYGTNTLDKPAIKRSLKVLLVDDIEENLQLCTIRLEQRKHRLSIARDGLEAISKWKKEHYDVVLMDAQMPNMDGFEATREIRKLEQELANSITTPIIAMTANAMKGDREKCLTAGMNEYISKPVDFDLLFAKIDKVVPLDIGIPIVEEEPINTPEKVEDIGIDSALNQLYGVDIDNGILVWGNEAVYQKSLISFVHSHSDDSQQIRDAWNSKNYPKAKSVIHALKGVAANLSIVKLSELCAELENNFNHDMEKMELLINDLAIELEKVTSTIKKFCIAESKNKNIDNVVDGDAEFDHLNMDLLDEDLRNQLMTLNIHLEAGDAFAAEHTINEIRIAANDQIPERYLNEVLKQIDDFDFFQAQELLKPLLKGSR